MCTAVTSLSPLVVKLQELVRREFGGLCRSAALREASFWLAHLVEFFFQSKDF